MSEELLRENERLKASNHRLEVEAIQRQGESDRVRLAARAENERLKSEIESAHACVDSYRVASGYVEAKTLMPFVEYLEYRVKELASCGAHNVKLDAQNERLRARVAELEAELVNSDITNRQILDWSL